MKAEDRRRYPRVFLDKALEDFKEIMGVQVEWPHGDVGGVLDISYIGAALAKPAGLNLRFNESEIIPLSFQFSNFAVKIRAQFVREISQALGVHFIDLGPEANLELEKFLKEKMIGLNTRFISTGHYSTNQSFSHWFHGPNDTNIFIWQKEGKIEKATIELSSQVLFYENGKLLHSQLESWSDADDYAYYLNYHSDKFTFKSKSDFFESVVSVLTQIQEERGVLDQLLILLKNT